MRRTSWAVLLGLGLVRAWTSRFDVPSDGLSYIEIGEAYWRGDWASAVNGLWSPLYSWLVGGVLRALRPSPFWESSVVHAVNLVIYGGALLAFEFLLRRLTNLRRAIARRDPVPQWALLPDWAFRVAAYSLFLWSCLDLIGVGTLSPDLLVAVCVFVATGLLLRIAAGTEDWRTYGLLGLTLALGYLSKAILFPMALVFLATAAVVARDRRRALPRIVFAFVVSLVVSLPYAWAVSRAVGRPTFGTSGAFNYSRQVNGIGTPVHWQGQPEGSGRPLHPTRASADVPGFFEFGSPISGTYPPWYDPTYWFAGIEPHLDLSGELRVIRQSLAFDARLLFVAGGIWVFALGVLLFVSGRGRRIAGDLSTFSCLAIPAAAAFGIYALVHTEARYVGAYAALLLISGWAAVRVTPAAESRRLVRSAAVLVFTIGVGGDLWKGASELREAIRAGSGENSSLVVAVGLRKLGIKPGQNVGYIGEKFRFYWARLAGVRIVAEIRQPPEHDPAAGSSDGAGWASQRSAVDRFWAGGVDFRQRAQAAFVRSGAVAVVTDSLPKGSAEPTWRRVGLSNYYYFSLQ